MKSDLEDRNNPTQPCRRSSCPICLNEVRPGRPEQSAKHFSSIQVTLLVSMKSGLEDRNNRERNHSLCHDEWRLNEVRPGRPEQSGLWKTPRLIFGVSMKSGLEDRNNEITNTLLRQSEHVSMKSGLEDRNNHLEKGGCAAQPAGLNEVRPGRPEQFFDCEDDENE